jgi:hypothetical protein
MGNRGKPFDWFDWLNWLDSFGETTGAAFLKRKFGNVHGLNIWRFYWQELSIQILITSCHYQTRAGIGQVIQLVLNNIPDNRQTDAEIPMGQNVSDPDHFSPFNFRRSMTHRNYGVTSRSGINDIRKPVHGFGFTVVIEACRIHGSGFRNVTVKSRLRINALGWVGSVK